MTSPGILVNTAELRSHSGDWLIVDLRAREDYVQGHIPGSVHLPDTALRARPGIGQPPPLQVLAKKLAALGIGNCTMVVALDDVMGLSACRLIWSLHLLGHRRCGWFCDGVVGWSNIGGAMENGPGSYATAELTPDLDTTIDVDREYLLGTLGSVQIWDCRSRAEYDGTVARARLGGHIPGALHYEWTDLLNPDGSVRDTAVLLAELRAIGLDSTQPVITHCQTHARSSLSYVVGLHLGLQMRTYAGSWAEWGNLEDSPVASGDG